MIPKSESKSQILAWELKDAAWQEVDHLPLDEAIQARLDASARSVIQMGLSLPVRDPRSNRKYPSNVSRSRSE
jgi:hypothetical protein